MRLVVLIGFAATLALAPMPLGSNRAWFWSPLAVVVGSLLLVWLAAAITGADRAKRSFARLAELRVSAVLVALVIVWGILQMSGWTPGGRSPISVAEDADFPTFTANAVAVDREQALTGLMRLLTYVGVFVLAVSLAGSASDARRLLAVIVASAVVYTLYSMLAGVANRLAPTTGITIWIPNEYYFTGPFINANNYATYAGISVLAALTLSVRALRQPAFGESASQRWRRWLGALSGPTGLWLAAAVILATGVVLSGSRAGCASLTLALIAMALLFGRGPWRWASTFLVLGAIAVMVLLTPAGTVLVTRTIGFVFHGEPGRETLFALALNAILLRPLTGWGLNSFETVYAMLQPPSLPEYFDKVHNTYLELAFDLGIPAAAMLIFAVVSIVFRCLIGFIQRNRDRELPGLGFLAAILVGAHALFDFSLQIPGVAVIFAAMLGIAWRQAWSSREAN